MTAFANGVRLGEHTGYLDELEWDVPAELASPAHAKVIAKELLRDPDRQRRAYSTQDLNV